MEVASIFLARNILTFPSSVLTLGTVLLISYSLYKYWILRKRFDGLPTFTGLNFISCYFSPKTLKNIPADCYFFHYLCKQSQLFKDGLYVLWILFSPHILIHKGELIKEVICHTAALSKPQVYDVFKTAFGSGLVTSKGDVWFSHRKLITPAFHLGILKNYISIFNQESNTLVCKFKEAVNEPWIDISKYFETCTMDILSTAALDKNMGFQNRDDHTQTLLKDINELAELAAYRAVRPWTQSKMWERIFPAGREMVRRTKFASKSMAEVIREKQESRKLRKKNQNLKEESMMDEGKKKKPFLEILLDCHDENPSFSMQEVKDEVNTFVASGHHTATSALKWTIFLISLHSDVQERLIDEIDSIFQHDEDRPVSYQDIGDLVYMDCVLKESMRLYPPVPFIARELTEDVQVGKYKLSLGSTIVFNIYTLHRDPDNFPDPEVFKPERFFPENSQYLHPFAFLPFSAGPRNCIGQKFVMMEMKVILCSILRNFRTKSLDRRDEVNSKWGISLENVEPIRIRLTPRHSIVQSQ